jgi:ornithine cyclodeaminase/alanine dehydrogenase-like protein (mu-crystallin family)
MSVRFFDRHDVERWLPAPECIEVMAAALGDLARGKVMQPLRSIYRPAGIQGAMALMPAAWACEDPVLGLKAVCVFPGNRARGEDAHQGAVLLLSGETGKLLAVLDGSAVTSIRTAAVSALATRLLARQDADILALIGAGVQARAHLEAIAHVRKLKEVRVASRGRDTARLFVREASARYPFTLRQTDSNEEAVRGAHIVVTTTTSSEPVLERDWLEKGTHVNAVGSSVPTARELDGKTLAAASLFADRRESLVNESGEYVMALKEGLVSPQSVRAELGEVVIGSHPGRTSRDEITLFKSLGLGIEDLAAARHVLRKERASAALPS